MARETVRVRATRAVTVAETGSRRIGSARIHGNGHIARSIDFGVNSGARHGVEFRVNGGIVDA